MSEGFDRKWLGLRFVDADVEHAYRVWARLEATPYVRLGMIGSLLSWAGVLLGARIAAPEIFDALVKWMLLVGPAIVVALAVTWVPKFHRALYPLTAFANAAAGLAATTPAFGVGSSVRELGLVGVIIVASFAFAIFRLPLTWALVSVTTYFGSFAFALLTAPADEGLTWERRVLWVTVLVIAYFPGALTCAVLETASRRAFALEKLVSRERAKVEQLLKQEISHQVAERSRALSETLAKVEVSLPATRLEPGSHFDARYVVLRELGKGGMGAVYEVERVTDGQRFALKVVTGNVSGEQAARFAREAEIGARLRHDNLVPIVDVGISPSGAPFLVMELIKGRSLEDHRDRFGDSAWALPILRQIAEGLRALHDAGVVHRDLKPANVLLSGELARISDFGISRLGNAQDEEVDALARTAAPSAGLKGHSLTQTGMLIGTPLYMAPEGARGGQAVDRPADVYALGLIAYEMLSGRLPFVTPPLLELMAGRPVTKPAPLEGPLGPTILACLAEDPAARPALSVLRTLF